MSRILLFGFSPLPVENSHRLHAPGIRTWQMASPLLADGHELLLVCCRYGAGYEADEPDTIELERPEDGLRCLLLRDALFNNADHLQALHDDFRPDCVVGATVIPSAAAVKLETRAPIWADLFGHFMAEGQAKASVYQDDELLISYFGIARSILLRADIFSTVSHAQELAAIGELGLSGRLNSRTSDYSFTVEIPCAMDAEPFPQAGPVIRGDLVTGDDFVILWSGGYNTWADVDTLFRALESAMSRDPGIRFVSIGGELAGQDDRTYPRFREMVDRSSIRGRCFFKGWIPTAEVPAYYADADVGINVDKDIYEVRLGSKNRILDWMRAGLPAVCSRVCELSMALEEAGVGYTYPPGDHASLADTILRLAADRQGTRALRRRVREYALGHYTFAITTEPLRRWVRDPLPAPDRDNPVRLEQNWYDRFVALHREKDRIVLDLEASLMKQEGTLRLHEEAVRVRDEDIQLHRRFREQVEQDRIYQRLQALRRFWSRIRGN
jgi:glycosyltransferase involved in cell wall biosynthesis